MLLPGGELTQCSDEPARRRQELSWIRIDKEYRFETDEGSASLADRGRGRSQLLIYHFMFGPDSTAASVSGARRLLETPSGGSMATAIAAAAARRAPGRAAASSPRAAKVSVIIRERLVTGQNPASATGVAEAVVALLADTAPGGARTHA